MPTSTGWACPGGGGAASAHPPSSLTPIPPTLSHHPVANMDKGKKAASGGHGGVRPPPPRRAVMFDDDGEEEEGRGTTGLAINRNYAATFEQQQRKKELQRAKNLGIDLTGVDEGGGASSEEDVSSDEGELLTRDVDDRIWKTITAIRKRDPAIYDPSTRFFDEGEGGGSGTGGSDGVEGAAVAGTTKPASKPLRAKDVLRQQLVSAAEAGATDAYVDEDEEEGGEMGRRLRAREESKPASSIAYDEEQRALRAAFLSTARGKGDGDRKSGKVAPHATGGDEDLLVVKAKHPGAKKEEEEESSGLLSRDDVRALLTDRKGKIVEHAGQLADPEAFLTAFMRSKAWRTDDDGGEEEEEEAAAAAVVGGAAAVDAAPVGYDTDEEELEKADEFEAKYNFRFEQPGGTELVSHARVVEGSLRRPDNKRKEERQRRKLREEEERAAAEAEVRRLMNLKRAELKSRVKKIQDVAGASVDFDHLASLFADELDKDFDPATYDSKMAALFGSDFYEKEEAEAGPDAPPAAGGHGAGREGDDDEEDDDDDDSEEGKVRAPAWVFGDGPRPAWAGPGPEELAAGRDGFEGLTKRGGPHGGGMGMEAAAGGEEDDDAYDPAVSGYQSQRARSKSRKRKDASNLIARAKAMLEADEDMDDPDEVLALGFEDVLTGGFRTRFKYTHVPAQDYGLRVEDVLLADDADLNRYVGLKRMAPYRDSEWVVPQHARKRALRTIRKKAKEALKAAGISIAQEDGVDAGQAGGEGEEGLAAPADDHTSNNKVKEAAPHASARTRHDFDGGEVDDEEGEAGDVGEGAHDGSSGKKKRRRHRSRRHGGAAVPESDGDGASSAPPPMAEGGKEEAVGAPTTPSTTAAAPAKRTEGGDGAGGSTRTGHKRRRHEMAGDRKKASPAAPVHLPSGQVIKKSRLESYGPLASGVKP